jgi:hypothetical protein
MIRKFIIAASVAAIGIGASAQAMANDWNRGDWRDRNHDSRVDWRDGPHHHWQHRVERNPHDLNRDGRVDWRDRQIARHWRDRNHDGRIDWRDNPRFY